MHTYIDADQAIYASCFSAKGKSLRKALDLFDHRIDQIVKHSGCLTHDVIIGGSGNFRMEVARTKPYKGSRSTEKPEFFHEVKEHGVTNHHAIQWDGVEADDVIAHLCYRDFDPDPDKCSTILASPDKDLLMVPGYHFNPLKPEQGVYFITEEEGIHFFAEQMLSGDNTDNIPGLPYLTEEMFEKLEIPRYGKKGVAVKRARDIMMNANYEHPLEVTIECYLSWGREQGLTDVETSVLITEQAQLLWMVREFNDKEPVMWKLSDEIQRLNLNSDLNKPEIIEELKCLNL